VPQPVQPPSRHERDVLPGGRARHHRAEHDGAPPAQVLQGAAARHADGQAASAGQPLADEAARVCGHLQLDYTWTHAAGEAHCFAFDRGLVFFHFRARTVPAK